MNELALITGGSGYFGSPPLRKLLAGGTRCRVLDLVDADDRPPEVEFIAGDICDPAAVGRACTGVGVVYHNVAQVPLAKDRHRFESVNVGGTDVLLADSLAAGVRKVVHTSSSAVFGVPRQNPVTEETVPEPGEAYGRTKLQAEQLCHEYSGRGLDVTVIRPRHDPGARPAGDLPDPVRVGAHRLQRAGPGPRRQPVSVRPR